MSEIRFDNLGPGEYERAKKVFDRAKHPGFVGRELFWRCATTGVACIAVIEDVDTGIALVAKDKLQALSVIVAAQGSGAGTALMARLKPKWVNAIGERVAWFEKRGYRPYGAARVGQNGKHATRLMERIDEVETADAAPKPLASVVELPRKPAKADPIAELAAQIVDAEGNKVALSTVMSLLQAARRGMPKRQAAAYAGISRQTLYRWLDPTAGEHRHAFAIAYNRLMSEACGDLIDRVAESDPKYLLGAVHKIRDKPANAGPQKGALGNVYLFLALPPEERARKLATVTARLSGTVATELGDDDEA